MLSAAIIDPTRTENPIEYRKFELNRGISMAANLRTLLPSELASYSSHPVQVLIDMPSLLVPIEEYEESNREVFFKHAFPINDRLVIESNVLPDLNAVALFGIDKQLKTVIGDFFSDATYILAMAPLWRYLYKRSFTGMRNKVYAYFHGKQLDIFAYQKNRFKFSNTFEAGQAHDALYFILYVWKQLNLQSEHDELHLMGEMPEEEWLLQELRRYLKKAYQLNPSAEYNRAPATKIKGMPFDMMTLLTKGR